MTDRPTDPATRHRDAAAVFGDRVRGTADWDVPTPVAGWTARDVVGHLTTWFPGFLAGCGVDLPPGPTADDDPVGAWEHQTRAVQALLDDPATAGRTISNPHLGELVLATAVDRIYVGDVVMHTWDLARATGQDDRLDPAICADMLAGMAEVEDAMRGSGQYGPAVAVSGDADPQTRMIGFIGRDPQWRPPGPAAAPAGDT